MRNCNGRFEDSDFRFQFLNEQIIKECPISYFGHSYFDIFTKLSRLKMLKKINVSINPDDITLLELDAFIIIESEIMKASELRSKIESEKGGKNGKRK